MIITNDNTLVKELENIEKIINKKINKPQIIKCLNDLYLILQENWLKIYNLQITKQNTSLWQTKK